MSTLLSSLMTYTLLHAIQQTQEIKKSRFIINASQVNTPEQASDFIHKVRDIAATHNCWAWKIGAQYRFSDDGEPTSTAGRPILAAIEGKSCDHIVVVVTRYFGGIKLGTGGLIRAYGGSASFCLQQAELMKIIKRIKISFHCYYSEWRIIENQLNLLDVIVEEHLFDEKGVHVTVKVTQDRLPDLKQTLKNVTRGRVIISAP